MKKEDKKRIERLEAMMLPKPTRPMLKIITRHVADDLRRLNKGVDADMVMVMDRPGERPRDTDPNTLTLTIVDTHVQDQDVQDVEPTDDRLEAEIERLEKRIAEAKHGKN